MRINDSNADWLVQKVNAALRVGRDFEGRKEEWMSQLHGSSWPSLEVNDASIPSLSSRCKPQNEAVMFSPHIGLQGSSHRGVAWLGTDVLFLARLSRASKTIGDSIHDGTINSIDGWQVVTENSNELGLIRLFREFFERNPPFCKGCRLTGQCGPNLWLGGCRYVPVCMQQQGPKGHTTW